MLRPTMGGGGLCAMVPGLTRVTELHKLWGLAQVVSLAVVQDLLGKLRIMIPLLQLVSQASSCHLDYGIVAGKTGAL